MQFKLGMESGKLNEMRLVRNAKYNSKLYSFACVCVQNKNQTVNVLHRKSKEITAGNKKGGIGLYLSSLKRSGDFPNEEGKEKNTAWKRRRRMLLRVNKYIIFFFLEEITGAELHPVLLQDLDKGISEPLIIIFETPRDVNSPNI